MFKTSEKYREYHRQYNLNRYYKLKNFAINFLGGKCVVCGAKEKLEIDHVDRKKKSFTVTKMLNVSNDIFLKELEKCQLLCRKHHNLKTLKEIGRKEAKGKHGTISSYRYCKCDLCREAYNKYSRDYKKRRRSSIVRTSDL